MRSVSAEMSDFLDAGIPALPAHLFTLTLAGGAVVRWTDYADDLTYGGNTFTAGGSGTAPLVTYGGKTDAVGTAITTAKVRLGCGGTARLGGKPIPLAALDGDLKGAWMKIERVFSPGDIATQGVMHVFEGPVSEAAPASAMVVLTIESVMGLLKLHLPKISYQAGCVHSVYSSECTLLRTAWTVIGATGAAPTTTSIPSALTQPDGHFALGVLTFTSGALAGVSRAVRAFAGGTFTPDRPFPQAPAPGDGFSVFPGCDKTRATCAGRFNNLVHFRGFPYVPKNENGRVG